MRNEILARAYDLPEPRRRRLEIVRDLVAGRSIVWLFPRTVAQEPFVESIINDCARQGLHGHVLRVVPDRTLPGSCIAKQYRINTTPGQPVPAGQLIVSQELPDFILLEGLDFLDDDQARLWVRFIDEWSQAAKASETLGYYPRALLILTSNHELVQLIKTDVYLGVHWLWGYLSTQELQLIARAIALERGFSYESLLWVQSVLVELAGCDPELLIWLIDNGNVTLDNYLNVLGTFAEQRGWSHEWLQDTKTEIGALPTRLDLQRPDPPFNLRPMWQQGIIEWDVDEGVVMHSAALALLQDELALEHRIWRGQAKALLPILDGRRLQICRFLDRSSHDWRKFCNYANENGWERSLSPHSGEPIAEYGTIVDFLKDAKINAPRRWRDRRSFGERVNCLRLARNSLAHYTPLQKEQFTTVVGQLTQICKLVG
ncbi:MAG TPA: hypothetical protein GX016_03475 [Firmicutes bacterium]|nr:hypothetical protein [Bacillota bacterium]